MADLRKTLWIHFFPTDRVRARRALNQIWNISGTVIRRQRIRFPPPMDDNFYDILDFNIGFEVNFYGKVFKIVNCDKFTRTFLNRCGITVPDAIPMPDDPFVEIRGKDIKSMQPKKPKRSQTPSFAKFIKNDKKVCIVPVLRLSYSFYSCSERVL